MHSFKSVSVDLWWHKRYFKYLAQNWTSNNEHDIYLFWTTEHLGWVLKFWLRYIHPANQLCPFETSTLYSPSCFPHTFGIWLSTWIYWLSKVTLNTYYMPETTQDASRKVNLPNGSMVQFLFFFFSPSCRWANWHSRVWGFSSNLFDDKVDGLLIPL